MPQCISPWTGDVRRQRKPSRAELPALGRIVQSSQQPLALSGVGDVQEALDDSGALRREVGLEGVDLVVASAPLGLGNRLVNPRHEHVLVMRAVEHADDPGRRQGPANAPQEVVGLLLGGRALEAGDLHPFGPEQADHVADHAALAGGVDTLQDQQYAARALGEQALLQAGQDRVVDAGALLLARRVRRLKLE